MMRIFICKILFLIRRGSGGCGVELVGERIQIRTLTTTIYYRQGGWTLSENSEKIAPKAIFLKMIVKCGYHIFLKKMRIKK